MLLGAEPIARTLCLAEFSALMVNIDSGYVEAAFHEFVRPAHLPKADACLDTELTGLTRAFIDRQRSFDIVYEGFEHWLHEIIVKYELLFATPQSKHSKGGANATFCTWDDWDLGHHFYRECKRNGIERRDCMKSWIDVRRVFEVSRLLLPVMVWLFCGIRFHYRGCAFSLSPFS